MAITRQQQDAHLESLPDEEARVRALKASEFHVAHGPDGELDANVCISIGTKHKGDFNDFHSSGY
jgi:hypothetical protein